VACPPEAAQSFFPHRCLKVAHALESQGVSKWIYGFLRENEVCFRRAGLPEVYRPSGPREVLGEGIECTRTAPQGCGGDEFMVRTRVPVRAAVCLPIDQS
jgi:hypothetical protein